ncbi:hypothetical protein [Streptomyces acidiscabies]|uniref:hypothetical protein n=1 Tax=Streptomyces acidiscabies TaxID=42234 RepID=UPI0038F62FA3
MPFVGHRECCQPRRARRSVTQFADNSRHGSEWAAKIYDDARRRQKRHLRSLWWVEVDSRNSLAVLREPDPVTGGAG